MWFERLVGFRESPEAVRQNLRLDGFTLTSLANGQSFRCGELETPSLGDLRERVRSGGGKPGRLVIREVVADVQKLHVDAANAGALFQVASQFNLLEMVGPDVTPEDGVDRYERDPTQGPACAIAAGPGTLYRNYFANVNGRIGQSEVNQIDCLADVGIALGNRNGRLWKMRNGYVLPSREGLLEISQHIEHSGEPEIDALRSLLRIGMQWNTQVSLEGTQHLVSQAYCSALPVAYNRFASDLWARFASLVLEASYEATLLAGVVNASRSGNRTIFLTLLGGGAFGNDSGWILKAIERACEQCRSWDLDVAVVSYGRQNRELDQLLQAFK